MRALVVFFSVFLTSVAFGAAPADKKVSELEDRLSQIEETYLKNSTQTASGLSRVESFQTEVAEIKGEQQANRHLIERTQTDLMDRLLEIEHRMTVIEDRFGVFTNQISRALKKINPAISQEGELYQDGLDKVSRAEYMDAIATFQSFLKKHPDSPFVEAAQYWIGECYYSLRDWQKAIKQFQAFVSKYPKDDKAPNAVLKQGLSFLKLNMADEAKIFLNQVISKYPGSEDSKVAKEKLDQIASGKTVDKEKKDLGITSYPEKTIQDEVAKKRAD